MKNALITSGITILTVLALLMVYNIIDKQADKKEIQTKIQSVPINVSLLTLDSTSFSFPIAKPVVLVLFNSTCEHCQYELGQINESIANFNEVELVFVSSESIATIKQVAAAFASESNVNFVRISPEHVYENFGTVRYPTILIYNANGNLIKEFKGETKIEAILQYARK